MDALQARGIAVKGIDKAATSTDSVNYQLHGIDLADGSALAEVENVLRGCDCIIHLAAARTDWGLDYCAYYRDNCVATLHLIEAAKRAGISDWLYTGTVGVYGPSNAALDETAVFAPDTDYGKTKAQAEMSILEAGATEGWAVRSIRPSAVFSEGQPPDTNLYRLIEAIRRNRFVLIGDGSEIKTTSYLHNLVDASLWLLEDLGNGGVEVFNYIDEPRLTTHEMIDCVRDGLGKRVPLVRLPLAAVERPARVLDWLADLIGRDLPITAARIRKFCTATDFDAWKIRRAGFQPRYSSYEALQRTVAWHAVADAADHAKVGE